MALELPPNERARPQLLAGLAAIAVLFLLQGALGDVLEEGADERARYLVDSGLASVELLSRIVYDVDETRVAIARDVFVEQGGTSMARLQRDLASLAADLRRAERAFPPLIEFPGEAELWQQVEPLLDGFLERTVEIQALSRGHRNVEAQSRLSASLRDDTSLNQALVVLVRLNKQGAANAHAQLASLQATTEQLQWGFRITGLVFLLLFGWWGYRRISGYEGELTRYAREVEARNRDLDAFAGRVSHDIKNAIGPIVMSPFMLRQFAADPDRVLQIADRTERCSQRVAGVLDALLAFSRSAQDAEPDEAAALRPVVVSVIEDLAPLIARLDVSVEVEDLPDVNVRCSPGLLHVVLANLFGNAVKYLEGLDERRVHITARAEDSSCRIAVEDTGPGIPEEAQERIFAPFYRVAGTRAPGTGIGLATVRRIVDARDGRIAVESTPGRGSRFTVWLPIAPSA